MKRIAQVSNLSQEAQ